MPSSSTSTLLPPPFLLGTTLIFWGAMTGHWMLAVPLACLLDGASFSARRFDFDAQDLRRVGQLTSLLLLVSMITAFNTNEGVQGMRVLMQPGAFASQTEALKRMTQTVLSFFQWLPIAFYPVALIDMWCATRNQDWRQLIWFRSNRSHAGTRVRREPVQDPGLEFSPLNVYFLVCAVASAATLAPGPWFLGGLTSLSAWMVFPRKTARYSNAVWIANAVVVCLMTTATVFVYKVAEQKANALYIRWIQRMARQDADFQETRTSIGSIGRIKNSGRVLFRVRAGSQTPPLLREATFTAYQKQSWHATRRKPSALTPDPDGSSWRLRPGVQATNEIQISKSLSKRRGILPLPSGVIGLQQLPAGSLETNRLGVAQVSDTPGFVSYTATFGEEGGIDSPPDPDDLEIPAVERPALERLVPELSLTNLPHAQQVRRLDKFFRDHFRYSLYLEEPSRIPDAKPATPLADFLLRTRSGHCEYFATATVLLLRQAGIPARYALGYSIQERKGEEYWIRDRHTHAWCLAFVDGRWRDLDTTPGSWHQTEGSRAGWWEPILDGFSSVTYHFSKWRWSQTNLRNYLIGSVWIAFAFILVVFLLKRRQFKGANDSKNIPVPGSVPGRDSDFYGVVARLTLNTGHPVGNTPLAAWIRAVARDRRIEDEAMALQEGLDLHYRYRFDPKGLSAEERSRLRKTAQSWLSSHPVKVR